MATLAVLSSDAQNNREQLVFLAVLFIVGFIAAMLMCWNEDRRAQRDADETRGAAPKR
jgi:hypothetical protein